MDLGLSGRVALVAASSRGLGRAIAEEFCSEGAKVSLCARGAEALERTRAELEVSGARVIATPTDLSDGTSVQELVERTVREFGPIEILVTNTGGPPAGSFESHDQSAWDQAVRENLDSVLHLCRAALPAMKKRRFGRILNVTSIAVKQPVDGLILSNAVRAAVTGFARSLANEVAPFGITVNNLLPGFTRTRRLEDLATTVGGEAGAQAAFDGWNAQIPMGRVGEPKEFAALAAFLASDRASYITGTSIPVDGGWTRSLF